MKCKACGSTTHDWFGDAWCDECHGVVFQKGDGSTILLFRHVANVRGPESGLPVVWDESAQHYMFRWPNTVNPRFTSGITNLDDDFAATPILSTFGPLDVAVTQALAVIREQCKDGDVPELSGAPSATPAEMQLLGV